MTVASPQFVSLRRGSVYLPISGPMAVLISIVLAVLTLTSTEPMLTFASLIVLITGAKLLWRRGEPPILFAVFFLQWLQVSMAIFRSSFEGVELTDLYQTAGVVKATWLSLFGLTVLAGGLRLALGRVRQSRWGDVVSEIEQWRLGRVFGVYCIAQIGGVGLAVAGEMSPGLLQPLLALANLKWVFFFGLAVVVFVQKRGYGLLMLVLAFEILNGFLSFFSNYKQVFMVLGLAFLTVRPKLNFRTMTIIALLFGAVLVLSAAWSVIKQDYRDFISGGSGSQSVSVSKVEMLSQISNLMLSEGIVRLPLGFEILARRIEYVYLFGLVVDRVPTVIPFADGALWNAAVLNIVTPRLLFPDKPGLAGDVFNTQYYTGLNLTKQGGLQTEIPLGYMAESYIDFGSLGMFVPIFLIGLLYGVQYRYLITRTRYRIFALGAAPVVLMTASQFEITAVKVLGGNLLTFGVFVIAYFLIVPYLDGLLRGPPIKPIPSALRR